MGWAVGYDTNWGRDIGYGIPAYCDHPECDEQIDRGLAYVCGSDPYGGDRGCGLYFCGKHLHYHRVVVSNGEKEVKQLCERCATRRKKPFSAKPDRPEWIQHKLTDPSWGEWRKYHPKEVEAMRATFSPNQPPE